MCKTSRAPSEHLSHQNVPNEASSSIPDSSSHYLLPPTHPHLSLTAQLRTIADQLGLQRVWLDPSSSFSSRPSVSVWFGPNCTSLSAVSFIQDLTRSEVMKRPAKISANVLDMNCSDSDLEGGDTEHHSPSRQSDQHLSVKGTLLLTPLIRACYSL